MVMVVVGGAKPFWATQTQSGWSSWDDFGRLSYGALAATTVGSTLTSPQVLVVGTQGLLLHRLFIPPDTIFWDVELGGIGFDLGDVVGVTCG
jgi:hypothetical protein